MKTSVIPAWPTTLLNLWLLVATVAAFQQTNQRQNRPFARGLEAVSIENNDNDLKNIPPPPEKIDGVEEEEDFILALEEEELPLRRTKKRFRKPVLHKEISNVHQLRSAVLEQGYQLKDLVSTAKFSNNLVDDALSHDVLDLMSQRWHSGSIPSNRTDPHKLALSIEGGGMRGAVSAGMAAALYALGFMDSLDVIYGSSAGSIIGAYMVSRQLSVDVYTDLLPNSDGQFVCKKRLVRSLLSNFANQAWGLPHLYQEPGMNTSYVLDSILCESGLRPLDMDKFWFHNEHDQELRVMSSVVTEDGTLEPRVFGTEDFTDATTSNTGRTGLFACLEASMMVPGATAAPVQISTRERDTTVKAFDAFCFEPLPYRSAVQEGATHVLVFRSRPQDYQPKTQPTIYETAVAPMYFESHGETDVAEFFRQGGQQYVYIEDHLLLEEARIKKKNEKVTVPPPRLQYGTQKATVNYNDWNRAHLYPVVVPAGTPELATLEQDSQVITEAVRGGFAAAFDLLAPIVGIESAIMTGHRAAELVFPTTTPTPTAPTTANTVATTKRRKRDKVKGLFGVRARATATQSLDDDDSLLDSAIQYDDNAAALALLKGLPPVGDLPPLHAMLQQELRAKS